MRFSTFAISLGLTLLFELPFVYIWGLRGRHNLALTVLVNVLTNPAAVLLHGLGIPALPLEAAVVVVEGFCYQTCGENVRRPVLLALAANVFSYGVGWILNAIF